MILLIDSYDSFTNNLTYLIESATNKSVVVIHNDSIDPNDYETFLHQHHTCIEYIVIGPGPGLPANEIDVGIIPWLFKWFDSHPEQSIPILGICLGFQCLCFNYGCKVDKLDLVKHGQIYDIRSLGSDEPLFKNQFGLKIPSVRYHSLFVDINHLTDDLIPLAVCDELDELDEPNNREILMAVKHKNLPFYGVQYHPESVCSSEGSVLIKNFDAVATEYNKLRSLTHTPTFSRYKVEETPLCGDLPRNKDPFVSFQELDFGGDVTPVDICDDIVGHNGDTDFILLHSASIPGQWSIVGLPEEGVSEVISHSVDDASKVVVLKYKSTKSKTIDLESSIWNYTAKRFTENYIPRDTIISKIGVKKPFPFLGGYLGLFSYEEGRHVNIEKLQSFCTGPTPDMKLIFVNRFLLFDHGDQKWYLMSVNTEKDDQEWCMSYASRLNEAYHKGQLISTNAVSDLKELTNGEKIEFVLPSEDIYKEQFRLCQEYLHSGDSYELCLTTSLRILLPSHIKSWDVYKILCKKNPSPFSCFMNFDDVCLISSSPERFVSWRGEEKKTVELRPIKGTVKNTEDMTMEKAKTILKTPKEMGENLMIVDLIRHDLHQFIQPVKVPQLMQVEEYKTVYQLVSVIQGDLENSKYKGIDILHCSLPPGSMTGAPKKRSIELLQDIEEMQPNIIQGGRRGVYSGVVGYWSVTDDSDWSVIIRSVFHYANDIDNCETTNVWRIGAGGAITVLSDCDGEWEEMKLKLASALQAFL